MVNIKVSFPGSCGELVQGIFNNLNCLVSCTIDKMSILEIVVTSGNGKIIIPNKMKKTKKAIKKTLEFFNKENIDVRIIRIKSLPEEKGYASSSADIFASIYGLAKSINRKISEKDVLKIAISIEPTDSILWRQLTLQSYRNKNFVKQLGDVPSLSTIVLDFGGTVNTVKFNQASLSQENPNKLNSVFELLFDGFNSVDVNKIGRASTLSALANQKRLYKPQLYKIINFTHKVDAAGICIAHSGSLIGILTQPDKTNYIAEKVENLFNHKPKLEIYNIVKGGPRFLR